MIGLLAQERLILKQLVFLTEQSFVLGERLSQPDFRQPLCRQPALTARDRAALRAFKCDDRRRVRAMRQMFNGHVVTLPWCLEFVLLTPANWPRQPQRLSLRTLPLSCNDPDQLCPIPDIHPAQTANEGLRRREKKRPDRATVARIMRSRAACIGMGGQRAGSSAATVLWYRDRTACAGCALVSKESSDMSDSRHFS